MVVGCSVGRVCFGLTAFCKKILGVDSTSRFFRIATLMQDFGSYSCKKVSDKGQITLDLKTYCEGNPRSILFVQQKPNNIDCKKFNSFDLVIVDNLCLPADMLCNALDNIHKHLKPNSLLIVSNIKSDAPWEC